MSILFQYGHLYEKKHYDKENDIFEYEVVKKKGKKKVEKELIPLFDTMYPTIKAENIFTKLKFKGWKK